MPNSILELTYDNLVLDNAGLYEPRKTKKNPMPMLNSEALESYCQILLALRPLRLKDSRRPIALIVSQAIRFATLQVTPFGAPRFVSKAAIENQEKEKGDRDKTVCEHIIPVGKINEHLVANWEKWSCPDLCKFLLAHSMTAKITAAENCNLERAGVDEKMPEGVPEIARWTQDDFCEHAFSRYKKAGIPLYMRMCDGGELKRLSVKGWNPWS